MAFTLGVAHLPGSPAYALLGKLATLMAFLLAVIGMLVHMLLAR